MLTADSRFSFDGMDSKIFTVLILTLSAMFLLFFFEVGQVDAQTESVWNNSYGGENMDRAFSIIQTTDGGYALAGFTMSFGAGGKDFWLVKIDNSGEEEWSKAFGGDKWDEAWALVQTADGGYALAGRTNYLYDMNTADFWLVKTDPAGNLEWSENFGGGYDDIAYSLIQTTDGGYALVGETFSYGAGSADFWLVKTDNSGNLEWSRTYGGKEWDRAYSVVQTPDGGYAIAGVTNSNGVGEEVWLVKTDPSGEVEWNRTYGGGGNELAYSLIRTLDGGFAMAAQTFSFGAGEGDFWLLKTDSLGHLEWSRTYGDNREDKGTAILQTEDGGYAIMGPTVDPATNATDSWLIKTDSSGGLEWCMAYDRGGRDKMHGLVQTFDGGHALAGVTSSPGTDWDFWFVKTDASGNSPGSTIGHPLVDGVEPQVGEVPLEKVEVEPTAEGLPPEVILGTVVVIAVISLLLYKKLR